jgi:GNAT superfamily N-acetyltransferase
MCGAPQFSTGQTRRLGPGDVADLQGLFERCSDFFELVEGTPTRSTAALEELSSHPPGKTSDDTFCFSVFIGHQLVAFANLARDYPKIGEWWLGLFLVDPLQRNHGFGAELHRSIVDCVLKQSGAALWLIVQAQNAAAFRFWQRQGYIERERKRLVASTGFESVVIFMSLSLSSSLPLTSKSSISDQPTSDKSLSYSDLTRR